jgi:predicted metal-dependent HD superfamily phosphohydrolase
MASSSLGLHVDVATTTSSTTIADSPATLNQDFRATSTTLKLLHGYWNRCCHSNNDEWFHRLWELHAGHTRHYHTAVHLLEMCQLFDTASSVMMVCCSSSSSSSSSSHKKNHDDEVLDNDEQHQQQQQPYDTVAILLAIFFHDAVYDATSNSNEEDSASLFHSFATETTTAITETTLRDVMDWIMATKTHQANAGPSSPSNPNLQLFLDLDMAVLGKTNVAYECYASLIRREYQHVPWPDYCEKRASILQKFLQQPHIYSTNLFQTALEQRARENLANEIESLQRGDIPGSAQPSEQALLL